MSLRLVLFADLGAYAGTEYEFIHFAHYGESIWAVLAKREYRVRGAIS